MAVHVMIGMLVCLASTGAQPNNEVQELRNLVNELREEVAELKHDKENDWLTEQRAEETLFMLSLLMPTLGQTCKVGTSLQVGTRVLTLHPPTATLD